MLLKTNLKDRENSMRDFSQMGKAFHAASLLKENLNPDPILQFENWMNEAVAYPVPEANAMTLSTATQDNQPNARIVLLKHFDETGFVFFGHYDSQKGRELLNNPKASLSFWWGPLDRQVRMQGMVSKTAPNLSADYFHSRPLASQIAAIVSPQSKIISSKPELIEKFDGLLHTHEQNHTQPDCPDYWGGFKFVPHRFEFWQGNAHRLHDRFVYEYDKNKQAWSIAQLAP